MTSDRAITDRKISRVPRKLEKAGSNPIANANIGFIIISHKQNQVLKKKILNQDWLIIFAGIVSLLCFYCLYFYKSLHC